MKVTETRLPGVLILEPKVYRDERGFFVESWNQERYSEIGISRPFVQDNLSLSKRNVLRGLHYQNPAPQAKLVTTVQGAIFDVVVDLRRDSPTFAEWVGVELSSDNMRQLYVPEGFAHGFVVMSETALFSYKCTALYTPAYERSLRWDDPEVGIEWPGEEPMLSQKDAVAPALVETLQEHLFGNVITVPLAEMNG
jgi:dTDP-4-dehydrorhamnose 3,5-epimerase